MTTLGQLCLLSAFVASGYAAVACYVGWRYQRRRLESVALAASVASLVGLTLVTAILTVALLTKDFRFAYVADYTNRVLPWYYALSALWVGQAGSLLLWAWTAAALTMIYRLLHRGQGDLNRPAFAILMAYQCFLIAIMVFGADPMQVSLSTPRDGAGLGPALQHPAMLLHPPAVFVGYALSAIPFALAVAALLSGKLDATWLREARLWAFLAWVVLGLGILVGAYWAYEELGWGGYWNWDPVENSSLIPWLMVTALVHAAMVYRQRGGLKRTTFVLAAATFIACNFAAFLTRSGVFSSLHAFSHSAVGWTFLVLIAGLATGHTLLLVSRRVNLRADKPFSGLVAKESALAISVFVMILFATVVFLGTVSLPITEICFPHKVLVGPSFYNYVMIPCGLLLLTTMAAAPLLRWGSPPDRKQFGALTAATAAGITTAVFAYLAGLRHPLAIVVACLSAVTVTAFVSALLLDARPTSSARRLHALLQAMRGRRRAYAGYVTHLAFACVAVGVTGSSLGSRERDVVLSKGESIRWAGRDVRYVQLLQRQLADRLLVQAELEVTPEGRAPYLLRPTQEYHPLQNEWRTRVAIHSNWSGDFYTILHSGEGQDRVQLTLVENPLMRWLWLSGGIVLAATTAWCLPSAKSPAVELPKSNAHLLGRHLRAA